MDPYVGGGVDLNSKWGVTKASKSLKQTIVSWVWMPWSQWEIKRKSGKERSKSIHMMIRQIKNFSAIIA